MRGRLLFDQFTGTAIVAGGEWLLFRVRDAVGVFAQRIDVAAVTLTGDRLRLIDSTRFAGGNTSIAASLSGTVIALAAESPGTDSPAR